VTWYHVYLRHGTSVCWYINLSLDHLKQIRIRQQLLYIVMHSW